MRTRALGMNTLATTLCAFALLIGSANAVVVVSTVESGGQLLSQSSPVRTIDFDLDGIPELELFSNGQDVGGVLASNVEILGIPAVPPNLGGWATPVEFMGIVSATTTLPEQWYNPAPGTFGFRTISTSGTAGYWPTGITLSPGPDGSILLVPESGYLGVRFVKPDGVHYAWVEVGVFAVGNAVGYLRSYAWETAPNTPLFGGSVPEPGRVVLFSIGLALFTQRRRRVIS